MKIGKSQDNDINLDINTLNKHMVIAGSSGSGKTTTIKTITQQLYNAGVSTLLFDAKGDIKDLLQGNEGKLYTFKGDHGYSLTVGLKTLGIDLLSNILDLNITQQGILSTCFLIAQDQGKNITTIQDLEKLFLYIIDYSEALTAGYGRLSVVSINTIRRKLNSLKLDQLETIFNNDNFNYKQVIQDKKINVIDSIELVKHPKLYASIVVMVLKQFYDNLEENDTPEPKAIIFIDEAHLLFKDTNKKMIEDIEQITKLIRSKGVGIVFISQSIYDIPNNILGQLTTKIQQQLNLLTTKDYSQARSIATTFTDDKNKINNIIQKIKTLQTGTALIQYQNENKLISNNIKIDYINKNIISKETLINLSPQAEKEKNVFIPEYNNHPVASLKQPYKKDYSNLIILALISVMFILFMII